MGNARLDNQIGTAGPDEFLKGVNILRDLDDGAAKPSEVLRIIMTNAFAHPNLRQPEKASIAADAFDVAANVF